MGGLSLDFAPHSIGFCRLLWEPDPPEEYCVHGKMQSEFQADFQRHFQKQVLSTVVGECLESKERQDLALLHRDSFDKRLKLDVVALAFNVRQSSKPAWYTEQLPGQPGLHREAPSQQKKKKEWRKHRTLKTLYPHVDL